MATESNGVLWQFEIPIPIPSYWKWRSWHWSKQRELQDSVLLILNTLTPPGTLVEPGTRITVSSVVYKKRLSGDEPNLTTPFDKLVLDNISRPKGSKKRGLGWIVDDSPEYVKVNTPVLRKAEDGRERTVITFEAEIE